MPDNSTCVVCVPVATSIENQCERCLIELEHRGYHVQRIFGCSAIDVARSGIATEGLERGYKEFMWVDSDICFNPDDVEKLRSHNLPFVCGSYPQKGSGKITTTFLKDDKIGFGKVGKLYQIRCAGFGFNLVKREVFEKVEAFHKLPTCNANTESPIVPYFIPMIHVEDGYYRYWAEDQAFCQRVKDAGIEMWCDTSIVLWHIGKYGYSVKDLGKNSQGFFNEEYSTEVKV